MYYDKEIINDFFKDIREFQKKVLSKTNNTYKISFIKYEKDENNNNIGTKRFTLDKSFFGKNLDKVIFKNKIYFKNKYKMENIYISLDEKNETTNLLWLDDVKLENFKHEQLKYMTLIETSPENYQAFIILDKEIDKNTLKQVKKYFVNKYNTDIGSIDFSHLMRLPYFFSYKHEPPFLVNVKQYQKEILPIDTILRKLKNDTIPKYNNSKLNRNETINETNLSEEQIKKFYCLYRKEKIEDFGDEIDNNVVDYRFLHYLYYILNININNLNLKDILYNLEERKKGHIDDYIKRITERVKDTEYNEDYKNNDVCTLDKIFIEKFN